MSRVLKKPSTIPRFVRIGVPAMHRNVESAFGSTPSRVMFDFYVEPLRRAGAVPVLLVPVATAAIDSVVAGIDGLLLAGGEDVDPSCYGAERAEETKRSDTERDEFEIELARAAVAYDLPMLAICRGVQVLNVALGGTLVQDLPDAADHDRWKQPFEEVHDVRVEAGSRLASIVGTSLGVNSVHHQGIGRLASGLNAVAHHPESGLVEGVEVAANTFCVGVQWHTEMLVDAGHEHQALVDALVDAANAGSAPDRENQLV